MSPEQPETLPPERDLALAHTPAKVRDALRIFFWFDQRLGRIIAQATEPMLAQMRLAWWRDMLGTLPEQRPQGDVVLDGIGRHWAGREPALVMLVDAWEQMLSDDFDRAAIDAFASGRAAPFLWLVGAPTGGQASEGEAAARRWALVDAAIQTSEGPDREGLVEAARDIDTCGMLKGNLRGLAVLDALARRSLAHGCQPLMEGRGAALVATRAAIFGR